VWDRCAAEGTTYQATCDGMSWNIAITSCPGGGCCTADAECPSLICTEGVCKETPPEGCWRDADCGPDSICSGAMVCPCGADCVYADVTGKCFPANLGCCRDATDCPAGNQCVEGMCKEPLTEPGMCWTNRDCSDGGVCIGAQVCPCDSACQLPDVAGVCG
jgi:hypothetical protein